MATEYIKESELYQTWIDAHKHMKPLFEPLDEFERIARNLPHPGIAKELPKVTDGTLAAFVQDTPKRVIQQIPTGSVTSVDNWLEVVATYILSHEILPNANTTSALIQKCWALVSKALTYGSQPAFIQFINRGEYFGTDFTLPYIKDVFLEPGKLSDRDSCVIMLRSWYTPGQIDGIIAREKDLQAKAKGRGEDYDGNWNLKALANLKSEKAQKASEAQTPNERGKADQGNGYIEIVHVFQEGIGANFYSFSPRTKETLRTKENKDPRGVIPIHYMYTNVDLSNPLGRGAIEMTGGMQNLLDSEVQAYQYMRMLQMNPPIKKRGTFSKSVLKYLPNAIWDLGANPDNDAEPVSLETKSLEQFPSNYGLIKSQIQNAVGGNPANDIPTGDGDPQSSKTPQGVQANQQRLGISDNYIRKQFEDCFQEISETLTNVYFGERSGTQELKLDPDTALKLQMINPGLVGPDRQVRINYDTETPKMRFKVDPSSSAVKDNNEQVTALQEVLAETSKNPYIPYLLQAEGKELHIGAVYEQLFERFGLQDIDKIITEIEKDPQTGQPKEPSVMTPFFDKPNLSAMYKDLPPKAQMQLLANGGVDVEEADVLQPNIEQIAGGRYQNPVEPAYVDPQTGYIVSGHPPVPGMPYVDPSTGKPIENQGEPAKHPVATLMEQLNIDFADLDGDTQRWVVQTMLGAPGTGPMPSELTADQQAHQQNIDATKTALEVAKAHHSATQDTIKSDQAVTDQALKIAQAHHSQENTQQSHEFQVEQAKQSNELAKKGAVSGKPSNK